MKLMSCERFDDETYYCPCCETTDHTDDWKCPHCGNYIRIKATMTYDNGDFINDIYFIRKTIYKIKIGDRIIWDGSHIYEVANKVKNVSQKNNGCSYRLALLNFGLKPVPDDKYYNCVL